MFTGPQLWQPSIIGAAPAENFGITASERELGALLPQLTGAPLVTVPGFPDPNGRDAGLNYLSTLTGGAISPENDPATWTPEEAAQQTDNALARIATANPELARTLAEQHGKSAEAGEDMPWYKDILKGVGTFLDVTGLDTVFDYMGRASHVIPEIIHDWGNESIWKNTADALTGRANDTTWSDVIKDTFGMGDSWFTAIAGFVGDVLTDPLTYVTFGAGGLGRKASAMTLSEAAVATGLKEGTIAGRSVADLADEFVGKLMASGTAKTEQEAFDAAGRIIVGMSTNAGETMASRAGTTVLNRIRKSLTGVSEEMRPGVFASMNEVVAQDSLLETIRFADDIFKAGSTVGWQRTTKEAAARLGIDKGLVDETLKRYVAQGTGFGVDKHLYMQGRKASAALGGVRLRMSIPVLDIRLAGARILPFTSRMDFSAGRRFFAGLSGFTRAMKMYGRGEMTKQHLDALMRGAAGADTTAIKELKKVAGGEAVARKLGMYKRSALFTASEGLAKGTRMLSPRGAVLRGGGLAAEYAAQVATQARHLEQQLEDELLTLTTRDGTVLTPKETRERFYAGATKARERLREGEELSDLLNEYRSIVNVPGANLEKYFEDQRRAIIETARAAGTEKSDAVLNAIARVDNRKARALELESRIRDVTEDGEYADLWSRVAHNRDNMEITSGQMPDTYNESVITQDQIHPDDAKLHSDGTTWLSNDIKGGEIGVEQLSDGSAELPIRGFWLHSRGTLDDVVDDGLISSNDLRSLVGEAGGSWYGLPEDSTPLGRKLKDAYEKNPEGVQWQVLTSGLTDEEVAEVRRLLAKDKDTQAGILNRSIERGRVLGFMDDMEADILARQSRLTAPGAPEPPRFAVVGPRRTLELDIRPGGGEKGQAEATRVVNEVTQIHGEMRPVLEDAAAGNGLEGLEQLPEETQEEILRVLGRENEVTQQLADLTSLLLGPGRGNIKGAGYTDILIHTPEGDRLLVFFDEATGTGPVAKVSKRATRVSQRGSQLRAITDQAREAIHGSQGWSGPKADKLIREITQATAHDVREVAEQKARQMLRDAGVSDLGDANFWERDPGVILDKATRATSARVKKHFVGEAARDAESLGLLRGGYGAGAVGIGRFRAVVNEAATAQWMKEVYKPYVKLGRHVDGVTKNGVERLQVEIESLKTQQLAAEEALRQLNDPLTGQQARERIIMDTMADPANRAQREGVSAGMGNVTRDAIKTLQKDEADLAKTLGKIDNLDSQIADLEAQVRAAKAAKPKPKKVDPDDLRAEFRRAKEEAKVVDTPERQLKKLQAKKAELEKKAGGLKKSIDKAKGDMAQADLKRKLQIEIHQDGYEQLRGAAADGRLPEGDTMELLEDLGNGTQIWVHRRTIPEDEAIRLIGANEEEISYFLVRDDKVLSHRRAKVKRGPQRLDIRRVRGEVTAITDPDIRALAPDLTGNNSAAMLLQRAHWNDVGITKGTWNQQYDKMSEAIAAQMLSEGGQHLNEKALKFHASRIRSEAKNRANHLKTQLAKTERDLEKNLIELADSNSELDKLRARMESGRAPLMAALQPAENAKNMTGMTALNVPGFEDFSMPVFMAEEFKTALAGYPALQGAHLGFRKFNNWWKKWATWLIPGFHWRNIQGAWFNNWLGGVGVKDYVTQSRVMRAQREIAAGEAKNWATKRLSQTEPELVRAMKWGNPTGQLHGVPLDELTYGDLALLQSDLNIQASNGRLFAEAALTVEEDIARFSKKNKGRATSRIPSWYSGFMRGAGTMTENTFRGAAFIKGLRDGNDVWGSRAFTMIRHGDYEDLTDFEYKWIRDIIPFYKWMRTNTPFQVHQLLENPGKLLAVQKGQAAVYDAQGLDWEKEKHRMPKWMTQGFSIPYGKEEVDGMTVFDTVMLDLPMSDLYMGGREFLSSMLPTIRPVLESYIYNQTTFSGKPLTGELKPMHAGFTPLAPLFEAFGLVHRDTEGRPMMSDKVANLMSALPLYTRFKSWIFADDASVKARANLYASALFGFQLRQVDMDTVTAAEMDFYYDQVLPTLEYLRDLGYPLPTTADIEDTIGTIDQVLMTAGIEPGVA